MHEETYDQAEYEQFEAECVFYDEGDRFERRITKWAADRELHRLRPYANAVGEVDYWRLELTLNELGRAFLIVDQFATEGLRS